MPELPEAPWLELTPDWVCKVLSPSPRIHDRNIKVLCYANDGVVHLLLADPDAQTLKVCELQGEHWLLLTTLHDDQAVQQPPFDAIEFPLDSRWA
jgi:Uma2 family endonuclease